MPLPWEDLNFVPPYLKPGQLIEFLDQMIEDGYGDEPIWVRSWDGENMWRAKAIELHEDDEGKAWFEIS